MRICVFLRRQRKVDSISEVYAVRQLYIPSSTALRFPLPAWVFGDFCPAGPSLSGGEMRRFVRIDSIFPLYPALTMAIPENMASKEALAVRGAAVFLDRCQLVRQGNPSGASSLAMAEWKTGIAGSAERGRSVIGKAMVITPVRRLNRSCASIQPPGKLPLSRPYAPAAHPAA